MSVVTSSLSEVQKKKLLFLLGHVRLHLLYKASVHGFTAAAFHRRCEKQGPTVIVAYNAAGFVFGAYTSQDYTESEEQVHDEEAFLYSINARGDKPLRVAGITGQPAFTAKEDTGPNYGALVFLQDNEPKIQSNPGTGFTFEKVEMHGNNLALTEFEVYRVEGLGGLLAKPWRNIQWTPERKQELMKTIQSYRPDNKSVHQARVLLVGPVGAGKSTFFNSINSVFRGNMTSQAITGTAGKSLTTQFRSYTIKAGKGGEVVPLILCDTMGLEENSDSGLDTEDLINIYKGHIKDRYQFSSSNPLQADAPGFKKKATLNDMIHCVVYMVDTCKVSLLTQKMLQKFASIRKKTNQLGIPQILLMTKVDEACPLVAEDLQNVYRSVYIQRKARELSESLGIPLSCVLPVKSYSEELELVRDVDILLLTAVEQMLNYSDSFFENQEGTDQPDLYRSQELSRPVIEASQRSGSGKSRTGSQSGVAKGNVSSTRTPSSSTRSAPAKSSPNPGSKSTSVGDVSVFVDLAYIPSGASSSTVSVDFFRCVHSSCYIISGDSQEKEELMRHTLDALLDAKMSWTDTMQVCLDSLPSVIMSVVTSSLSEVQKKKLLFLLGHVRLHLLYKASVHGFTAAAFYRRCEEQGPTVIVAYNAAGFVFGAYTSQDYTSQDYTETEDPVYDEEAFLYSINARGDKPLRVAGITGQPAFTAKEDAGPDYGALVFLQDNEPKIESNPGTGFTFEEEEMHGDDLALTEFEVYRVEGLGGLLAKPWRNIRWTAERKQELMNAIQSYKPDNKSVHQARGVLVGPVGAGKSTFFNSINSVFRGNMTSQAITGTAGKSLTTQFRSYTIKAGKGGEAVPLILCDTMGLEENADTGLDIEDLVNIFKGHMKDRYRFSSSNPLQADAPGFKKKATLNDMIHCVVYVVDTCKVSLLTQKMLQKFASIRKKTNQLGIPQILLMTKVDEACPLVAEDLQNVYRSVYIQRKARELSESLGIPMSCVLPVKSYSEELELDRDVDILLLTAVEQMLNYSDSFFENQEGTDQPDLYRFQELTRPVLTD